MRVIGTVFPWRSGNRFELLVDGPVFFPRMLAAIEAAQRCVDLELYLAELGACSEQILPALVRAAERGVTVRCLFDGYGSLGLGEWLQRLEESPVQLRLYNPTGWRHGLLNLYRDHRKLLVCDGELAYVGGTGITDQFWTPEQDECEWHEVMVEMAGPVVSDWLQLFERQWQACHARAAWKPPLPISGAPIQPLPARPTGGNGWGRVAYADALQHRDILVSLLRSLRTSRQRIWLATPYFLPTWSVRRALRKAAARGVDVRLLLTGPQTDNPPVRYAGQRYYPKLLRAGVRIFEYQPRFLHLKMVLVDDWLSVGSCNFDHWNLRFNLDANLEALDPALTAEAVECFNSDFARSHEITMALWKARPRWMRLQQRIWGWLNLLVANLFNRGR